MNKLSFLKTVSHGRAHKINLDLGFLTDRENILTSKSFRRLEYKTQVFLNHVGDHYRNRLTHSLEVGLLAKKACRILGLNEDLAECIGLAHDLGHTPFGHCGQDVLNELLEARGFGHFEHNMQSFRIITELDSLPGEEYNGLNLSFETIEGLAKHRKSNKKDYQKDLPEDISDGQETLEAQIGNACDEITYNCHDLDDGLRHGILEMSDLSNLEIFQQFSGEVKDIKNARMTIRKIKEFLLLDLVEETKNRVLESGIIKSEDIRESKESLVSLSKKMKIKNAQVKKMLNKKMYNHFILRRREVLSRKIIYGLFDIFFNDPTLMPLKYSTLCKDKEKKHGEKGKARAVSDYISGMTDRFAMAEYNKLFDINAI